MYNDWMRRRAKISYQHFDTCDYIYYCIRTEAENILTNLRHAYTLIVYVYTAYMIIIWFFFNNQHPEVCRSLIRQSVVLSESQMYWVKGILSTTIVIFHTQIIVVNDLFKLSFNSYAAKDTICVLFLTKKTQNYRYRNYCP